MAVVSVTTLWQGQTGRIDESLREWTIIRMVEVDNPLDDAPIVCFAPGVGILGQPYSIPGGSTDVGAILREVTPDRVAGTRLKWVVTERYSTKAEEDKNEQKNEDGEPEDDPEKWRDELDISYRPERRVVDRATNRVALGPFRPINKKGPIINSAGAVLNAYEEDLWIQVLRIVKRRKKYPAAEVWATESTVNNDDFTISKPKQGLVLDIKKYQAMMPPLAASLFYMPDSKGKSKPYWKCVFEVHIEKKYGWRLQVQDKGVHRRALQNDPDGRGGYITGTLQPGQPPLAKIRGPDGTPITEDVLLDGFGQPLGLGKDPVYLEYSVKEEIPYQPIKL